MASKKELERRIKELEEMLYKNTTVELVNTLGWLCGKPTKVPTIKSKVDAIIEHLGIEVAVEQSEEKVVARKVKK